MKQLLELMLSCGHDRRRTRTDKVNLGPRINAKCLQKFVRGFRDLDPVSHLLLNSYVRVARSYGHCKVKLLRLYNRHKIRTWKLCQSHKNISY